MKKLVLLIFLLLNAFIIKAQEDVDIISNYDKSYIPSTTNQYGRYEIIQSNMVALQTFKVDKYEGNVYIFTMNKDSVCFWNKVPRVASAKDIKKPNCVNYQLYTSGLAAKYCFLININTGITWQLFEASKDVFCFGLISTL